MAHIYPTSHNYQADTQTHKIDTQYSVNTYNNYLNKDNIN